MAITFDNIAGGELAEKFTMALAQIGRYILDPNMDPEAARGMTININFKPKSSGVIDIKIVEAENGIWKNEAVSNIKKYFADAIMEMPEAISKRITIIG